MSNDRAKGRKVAGSYLARAGRARLAGILVAVAIWPVSIQPQATQAAPPPPTPIATPTPQPTEPGLSAQGVTLPSPDKLPPEVEQARAHQAMEAALVKYLRYWGPRYRVAPVEVTVEGEWAHGVAQWQSQAKTLSGPIRILARRQPDGSWQALMPGSDGLYPQWVDAAPESLVPASERSQLRTQAAEADALRRPQATPVVPLSATLMTPGEEKLSGALVESTPELTYPTATPMIQSDVISMPPKPEQEVTPMPYHDDGSIILLDDTNFSFRPEFFDFDIRVFLQKQAPALANYKGPMFAFEEDVAEMAGLVAHYYGINPKVLLTVMEVHAGLLSHPSLDQMENRVLGYWVRPDEQRDGLCPGDGKSLLLSSMPWPK